VKNETGQVGRMKPSDIKVGGVYRNRGKGTVTRRVLAIGSEYSPDRFFGIKKPMSPGVLYLDSRGSESTLFLSSFASWAGSEVSDG